MTKTKRKIIVWICVGFLISFLSSVWGLTVWKTEDLRDSMHNDFMSAYNALSIRSRYDDDFTERAEDYLTEFSFELAQRNIYATAAILDAQGEVLVKSDVSNIYFNGRIANAVDSTRLANCIHDAQDTINSEHFPKGQEMAGISSSGPFGYIQGETLANNNGNMRYMFVNAKFFERELAIKEMIWRYVLTFILMGMICLVLCAIVSKIIDRKEISYNANIDSASSQNHTSTANPNGK